MTMCDKKNIETSENCVLSAPDFLRCSLAFFSLHCSFSGHTIVGAAAAHAMRFH